MKEFRCIDIDAAELVRNLGQMSMLRELARPIGWEDFGRPLQSNSVRAIWARGGNLNSELPSTLLSSEITFSDLLPRLLALPSTAMPISVFMRTWLIEDFQIENFHHVKALNRAATLGFVGVILAELREAIGPNADFRFIGMDSVRRTLSFVLARSIIKGWKYGSFHLILERWLEASALTLNETNIDALIPIANICGFLQVLSDLGELDVSSPIDLAHHIQSWVETQSGSDQRDLLHYSLSQLVRSLDGVYSRERRYDLIMESLAQMKTTNETVRALERGFLISLIEPGSFEFLDLAKQVDPNGGATASAYCACAAIMGKEGTLGKFNGFGWNVFNFGLQPSTELSMDVSLTELRILHHARRGAPIAFRTRSPALIDVEIAPMVTGSFGNVARRKFSSNIAVEETDVTERDELLREGLAKALRAVEDAYGLLQAKRPKDERLARPKSRMKR